MRRYTGRKDFICISNKKLEYYKSTQQAMSKTLGRQKPKTWQKGTRANLIRKPYHDYEQEGLTLNISALPRSIKATQSCEENNISIVGGFFGVGGGNRLDKMTLKLIISKFLN